MRHTTIRRSIPLAGGRLSAGSPRPRQRASGRSPITKHTLEICMIAILPRDPRGNQGGVHLQSMQPVGDPMGHTLRTIALARRRSRTLGKQPLPHLQDLAGSERPCTMNRPPCVGVLSSTVRHYSHRPFAGSSGIKLSLQTWLDNMAYWDGYARVQWPPFPLLRPLVPLTFAQATHGFATHSPLCALRQDAKLAPSNAWIDLRESMKTRDQRPAGRGSCHRRLGLR
jgi:hypothetical protein